MSGGGGGYQYVPVIQNQSSSSSGTNSIPLWLENASRQGVGYGQSLLKQGTQAYGGQLVPGMTADQTRTGDIFRNSIGSYSPYFDQARNALSMGMQSINPQTMASGLQNIGQYMNPYVSSVIDAARAYGEKALGNNLNQIRDGALRSGAAYGSRHGVQEGVAASENAFNQQQFAANALSDAYGKAAGYLSGDITNNMNAQQQNAANAMNAGNNLSQLATAQRAANVADVNNMFTYGSADQQNTTAQNQAAYNEWLRTQNQPMQNWLGYMQGISAAPKSTSFTSNTNSSSIGYQPQQQQSSSPIMGALGGGMSGAVTGAQLGTLIPGIGPAGGALGGAALGAIMGGFR